MDTSTTTPRACGQECCRLQPGAVVIFQGRLLIKVGSVVEGLGDSVLVAKRPEALDSILWDADTELVDRDDILVSIKAEEGATV
jgi:hypothetical protein